MATASMVSSHWLEIVSDVLERPTGGLPHNAVSRELVETFDVVTVSWNWRNPDGRAGFELTPSVAGWSDEKMLTRWQEPDLIENHPLVMWFAVAQSAVPQTIGRVPDQVCLPAHRARYREYLREFDSEQQLSIPYVLSGTEHRAFVLCRSGTDFTDEELALAGLIQRLLQGLERQTRVLATLEPRVAQALAAVPLTGRETAVLGLLVCDLTAEAIAHRLAISPRTVHKHLEHIYRKLGVRDRLAASQVGTALAIGSPGRGEVDLRT
jgi:DNA-binding CsgD family transcriptional regulator